MKHLGRPGTARLRPALVDFRPCGPFRHCLSTFCYPLSQCSVRHSDPQTPNPLLSSAPCTQAAARRAGASPHACKMNLGRTTVQIHRMQQPIRTPRAPAVARLVASAHRKNCEEARSSGGPPRRIPPNFPEVRSPSESIRTLNRNSFLEVGSHSCPFFLRCSLSGS